MTLGETVGKQVEITSGVAKGDVVAPSRRAGSPTAPQCENADRYRLQLSLSDSQTSEEILHAVARSDLRQASRLRERPHPVADRRRRVRIHAPRPRSLPQGRLPDRRGHDPPARRGAGGSRDRDHRQDRGSGQHHQRRSTSSVRPRPKASRRSSSRSCSRRTPTSRRRKCATASTACCRCCPRRSSSRRSRSSIPTRRRS